MRSAWQAKKNPPWDFLEMFYREGSNKGEIAATIPGVHHAQSCTGVLNKQGHQCIFIIIWL